MSDAFATEFEPPIAAGEPTRKARTTLAKRLADIVCLPTSRITPQERHLTGDLLIEMLKDGDLALRTRCARRIAALSEAPSLIVRFLARDEIEVARPILEDSDALSEGDLVATAYAAGPAHRAIIAARRDVTELVADAIVAHHEPDVIATLLSNKDAEISQTSIEHIVADSRDHDEYPPLLAGRAELRPGHGFAMFWWADPDTRRVILRRFAVERQLLQEAASDVFAMAAAENWSDPLTRKALQFIERRQRNRGAIAKSPFASLEDAIDHADRHGVDRSTAEEISYLAGLKPATGAKLLSDIGGEPIAVLCKGTGLKRAYFNRLWTALRRPISGETGEDAAYERALETFDSLSADKAQTVLRYWNWALTSAFAPTVARALDAEGASADGDLTTPELTARLVFGRSSNSPS